LPKNTGNSRSNSKNQQDWQKFDFVEIRLDEKEKAAFKKMYADKAQELLGVVPELLSSGYKLSLTWDENNKTYIASITCKAPLDPNFNYIMTSRAGDPWEAVALGIYKHQFMCDDGDWGGDTKQNSQTWG